MPGLTVTTGAAISLGACQRGEPASSGIKGFEGAGISAESTSDPNPQGGDALNCGSLIPSPC